MIYLLMKTKPNEVIQVAKHMTETHNKRLLKQKQGECLPTQKQVDEFVKDKLKQLGDMLNTLMVLDSDLNIFCTVLHKQRNKKKAVYMRPEYWKWFQENIHPAICEKVFKGIDVFSNKDNQQVPTTTKKRKTV